MLLRPIQGTELRLPGGLAAHRGPGTSVVASMQSTSLGICEYVMAIHKTIQDLRVLQSRACHSNTIFVRVDSVRLLLERPHAGQFRAINCTPRNIVLDVAGRDSMPLSIALSHLMSLTISIESFRYQNVPWRPMKETETQRHQFRWKYWV